MNGADYDNNYCFDGLERGECIEIRVWDYLHRFTAQAVSRNYVNDAPDMGESK